MSKYLVGYGKPPKESQFKPGKSGNMKGRPKGRISTARLLEKHMDTKVTVNIGGKQKKVSRREALVLSAIGDAFKGNEKVRRQFLDLVLSFDATSQAENASAADMAQDQAVVDALLYSYGVKGETDKTHKLNDEQQTSKTGKQKKVKGA